MDQDHLPQGAPEGARSVTGAVADLGARDHRRKRPAHDPEAIRRTFETGRYPYAIRLTEKDHVARIMRLQVELLTAQSRIKAADARATVLFEGRDAADKRGSIKRFMEHLDLRRVRIEAMRHVLHTPPCEGKDERVVYEPDPLIVGSTAHVIGASTHILGMTLDPGAAPERAALSGRGQATSYTS